MAERVRDNPPPKRKSFTLESQSIGCLMEGREWHFSDLSGLGPDSLSDATVQQVNDLLGPQPCLVTQCKNRRALPCWRAQVVNGLENTGTGEQKSPR